jgi:hypothetical protein
LKSHDYVFAGKISKWVDITKVIYSA